MKSVDSIHGNNRDMRMVRWAWGEPVRTLEKCGHLGRRQGGTDSDGYETEIGWNGSFGHVKRRDETEKKYILLLILLLKHPSSCRNEDGGGVP